MHALSLLVMGVLLGCGAAAAAETNAPGNPDKEEIGLMWTLNVNSVLMTRDWCDFFDGKHDGFSFRTSERVAQAILVEGNLSRALQHAGRSFSVPLHDPTWSDEALIELTFEPPTETADETPRTVP